MVELKKEANPDKYTIKLKLVPLLGIIVRVNQPIEIPLFSIFVRVMASTTGL